MMGDVHDTQQDRGDGIDRAIDSQRFVARSVAPAFPVRMLALDIDGTLVGEDLVLRERTRLAIHRAVHHGIRVSLVTGRMTASAVRFAQALDLRDPIVGYQGALIRAMPGPGTSPRGRLIRHARIPTEVARAAIRWSRSRGLMPHINHVEDLVIPADDPRVDDYSAFLGLTAVRRPVTKVVAVGDPPLPVRLLDPARRDFDGLAGVTVAHPRFLEFVAPGTSKGQAVRWLSRRHGIPLGQILAIGDQWNDVEMLSAVGHGVAMPSAPPEVIGVARYVAPPLEEEGAAQVIETMVLADERRARAAAERYGDPVRLEAARQAAVAVGLAYASGRDGPPLGEPPDEDA
jgi:hydroxymethylpyrimidine pyrophosphatase-like HAD family hydrolase